MFFALWKVDIKRVFLLMLMLPNDHKLCVSGWGSEASVVACVRNRVHRLLGWKSESMGRSNRNLWACLPRPWRQHPGPCYIEVNLSSCVFLQFISAVIVFFISIGLSFPDIWLWFIETCRIQSITYDVMMALCLLFWLLIRFWQL